MQRKNVIVGVVIIAVLVVTAIVAGQIWATKTEMPVKQEVSIKPLMEKKGELATAPAPKEMEKTSENNPLLYTSKEFSFSVLLPETFQKYKTEVYIEEDGGSVIFYMPTKDPDFQDGDLSGHVPVFYIDIWKNSALEELRKECNSPEDGPQCAPLYSVLMKNNDVSYVYRTPQEGPFDSHDREINQEYLKKNIKYLAPL
jgi:hypothetical protein